MKLFLQRSLYRLTLTAGIFCFIEIFFQRTEGTRPNDIPPWSHDVALVAVAGCFLLAMAWISRPAEPLPSLRISSKKANPRREV